MENLVDKKGEIRLIERERRKKRWKEYKSKRKKKGKLTRKKVGTKGQGETVGRRERRQDLTREKKDKKEKNHLF